MTVRTRLWWCVVAAVVGLLAMTTAGVPARAGGTQVRIREADARSYPEVAVTVSVLGAETVDPADVAMTVDGEPAGALTVTPLASSGRAVEAVLVVDVSGSMEGEPIRAAIAAGKRFVRSLPPGIEVGVVSFSHRVRVARPISGNRPAAIRALDHLRAGGETALNDAVIRAAGLFGEDAQPYMLLLSDGKDTASRRRLSTAIAAASSAGATVDAVGLRGSEADVAALRSIAHATGGTVARADTPQLERVYAGVARDLAHQFVASFLAPATTGGELEVVVTALGASATTRVPLPSPPHVGPPATNAHPEPLPAGGPGTSHVVARGLVLATFFFALSFGLAVALVGTGRARRARALSSRIGPGLGPAEEAGSPTDPAERGGAVREQMIAAVEGFVEPVGLVGRVSELLERGAVRLRPGELLLTSAGAGVLVGVLAFVATGSLLFAVPALVVAGAVPFVSVWLAARRRSDQFERQLPDILMVLASSLRAGHSFLQALDTVAKDITEPAASEFQRVVAEIRLGRTMEESMGALARRVSSPDFDWVMLAVSIQREVGGNLAEILDTVSETLRERAMIRRQIRTLSAEGRISMYVLIALPFALFGYVLFVNPEYASLLFTDPLGRLMLVVGLGLLGIGVVVMRKMVRIDV